MKRLVLAFCVLVLSGGCAAAQTLPGLMADVAFLIGDWQGTSATHDNMTDRGTSSIHLIVGGNALLRRDHTDVVDTDGKIQQSFDQIMLIYAEGDALHADYLDGAHVIHYTQATIEPGEAVSFRSVSTAPGAPEFRLSYRKTSANTLSVVFEMQPPGAPHVTVATGTLTRK